jgi:hypothetical protein
MYVCALEAWHSGHRVRLHNRRTEGFESRQGLKFLGLYTLQCC